MPAFLLIAKRAADPIYNGLAARDYASSVSNYNNARGVISGGIIAVIVIAIVFVLAVFIGGCCIYSRKQDRRRQRQAELNKWHKDHPNSNTYEYSNTSSAPPPPVDYAYGAGVTNTTDVKEPGAAYTAAHHGAVHHGSGFSSAVGGNSGGGTS
ncbi:hypothetical protein BKA67DRAFT_529334 [Truncatella angustata]|uniref:Uncharacterized protein n=1 Tax=Truncatella angustata TaxID=152316 RepID=A0A9P8UVA4_9PEZI|nr:uncharacterized protein BKA67DRAFT_529334 [Truncatella angustata]KAH6659156.1 hypothetical protein BKA67DRAFT_529334 [Truncatella angustata]KAH8204885.1 hypothetical protein TruAng_000924 [Truncatella angustata]